MIHTEEKKMNKSNSTQSDTDVRISRKEHERVIIASFHILKRYRHGRYYFKKT